MLLQTLMSFKSPEITMAMKAVNILMREINERLEYVKGRFNQDNFNTKYEYSIIYNVSSMK